MNGASDERPQRVEGDGLRHASVGDALRRVARTRGEGAAAHEHHAVGGLGIARLQRLEQVDATHPRHHEVAEDQVEAFAGRDRLQRLFSVEDDLDIVLVQSPGDAASLVMVVSSFDGPSTRVSKRMLRYIIGANQDVPIRYTSRGRTRMRPMAV